MSCDFSTLLLSLMFLVSSWLPTVLKWSKALYQKEGAQSSHPHFHALRAWSIHLSKPKLPPLQKYVLSQNHEQNSAVDLQIQVF